MPRSRLIVLAAAAFVLAGAPAQAGVLLGVDLHGAKPLGEGSDGVKAGLGLKGGIGYTLPIPVIDLTPEVQIGWTRFGAKDLPPDADGSTGMLTAMAGARVAIGALLKPFAYFHVGYARESASTSRGGQTDDLKGSGPAFDVGGGLVFTALPLLDIGAFAGYTKIGMDTAEGTVNGVSTKVAVSQGAKWADFGAFVSLHF